jgi:7-cyano-7-deazaguanine reductase
VATPPRAVQWPIETLADWPVEVCMTDASDLDGLTKLGRKSEPSKTLETFPNHNPERDYVVRLETDEFTCVCPATGQPDFGHILVEYVPDKKVVESKSFKLYLWSYRDEGVFHEHVVNKILDDLVSALEPRWCRVEGAFNIRGGIGITVEAEHGQRRGGSE